MVQVLNGVLLPGLQQLDLLPASVAFLQYPRSQRQQQDEVECSEATSRGKKLKLRMSCLITPMFNKFTVSNAQVIIFYSLRNRKIVCSTSFQIVCLIREPKKNKD